MIEIYDFPRSLNAGKARLLWPIPLGLVIGAVLSLSGSLVWSQSDWGSKMPEGEGKELTVQLCGTCHDLGRTLNLRKDGQGWEQTVLNMVTRGAQIFPDEAEKITRYLTTNYGMNSPLKK
jgi:hypothetical protein